MWPVAAKRARRCRGPLGQAAFRAAPAPDSRRAPRKSVRRGLVAVTRKTWLRLTARHSVSCRKTLFARPDLPRGSSGAPEATARYLRKCSARPARFCSRRRSPIRRRSGDSRARRGSRRRSRARMPRGSARSTSSWICSSAETSRSGFGNVARYAASTTGQTPLRLTNAASTPLISGLDGATSEADHAVSATTSHSRSPPVSSRLRGTSCVSRLPTRIRRSLDYPRANPSRSSLSWFLWVSGKPCGAPGYSFSFAFLTSFTVARPDASIGTIWSSSP